jgi:hypothetical protein
MVWNGFMWLRIGASGGIFEHGNEILDLIKCGEMVDKLRTY